MSKRVTISNESFDLELDPAIGGSVTRFHRKAAKAAPSQPIFRDAAANLADAGGASAFPLVPFSNRIRGGRFSFRGREVTLTPNLKGDPSPLHGQGWRAAWAVADADDDCAELRYSHDAGEWPWAYQAHQRFCLDNSGLDYAITVRNVSHDPMPAGLGLHPYFPSNARTVLSTRVDSVWVVDKDVLPIGREAPAGRYDLRDRRIDGAGLDNGYGGWSGSAEMSWPDRDLRVRMSSPTARFFQVYAPESGGVFVAEPVTHANTALNHPEAEWRSLGLHVLAPDEEMRLTVRFDVSAG
ncbi:MAG TPA: aldose 1-epimerase [Caulobacteraceae bacterium]|jgi:aldose 1-epimerase